MSNLDQLLGAMPLLSLSMGLRKEFRGVASKRFLKTMPFTLAIIATKALSGVIKVLE